MKKTLIVMVDEKLHEGLRKKAFEERISMAEIVRMAIKKYIGVEEKNK